MSECVVRMEMPQGCWCCPFGHYDWIWGDDGREKMVCFCCLDLESEEDGHYLLETELKRPSWCPIICSLPEGHGRLVDADALNRKKKHLIKTENGVFPKSEWFIKANDLFAAQTIVPAERSENERTD